MSLFGSLFTGVSALNAQSQSLSVIANNIANVNTTGYKKLVADFSDLVVQGDRNAVYSSGGVRANTGATLEQQGSLNQTGQATDIALSGNGFFVVKSGPNDTGQFYTRAGSFKLDSSGYLVNQAGYYLVGQPISAAGTLGGNQPIQVNATTAKFQATSEAKLTVQLNADQDAAATAPHFTRTMTIYDSLGGAQDLALEFSKTGVNTWNCVIKTPGGTTISTQALTFTNGKLTAPAANPTITIASAAPPAGFGTDRVAQPIELDFSTMTQYAAAYDVTNIAPNGVAVGGFRGVTIDGDGFVIANYTNGLTEKIAQLPVVTFANANAMNARSGNVYEETLASGQPNYKISGSGGAGKISPSTLEQSNVDLAEEFSRMIVTQRAYSAGTKVISTSNDMLQELLNIR